MCARARTREYAVLIYMKIEICRFERSVADMAESYEQLIVDCGRLMY